MSLYSCRAFGSSFRLVRFDNDLNVEAIYNLTERSCDCPQGIRAPCKHTQEILPEFQRLGKVDSGEFYDPENDQWHEVIAW